MRSSLRSRCHFCRQVERRQPRTGFGSFFSCGQSAARWSRRSCRRGSIGSSSGCCGASAGRGYDAEFDLILQQNAAYTVGSEEIWNMKSQSIWTFAIKWNVEAPKLKKRCKRALPWASLLLTPRMYLKWPEGLLRSIWDVAKPFYVEKKAAGEICSPHARLELYLTR